MSPKTKQKINYRKKKKILIGFKKIILLAPAKGSRERWSLPQVKVVARGARGEEGRIMGEIQATPEGHGRSLQASGQHSSQAPSGSAPQGVRCVLLTMRTV